MSDVGTIKLQRDVCLTHKNTLGLESSAAYFAVLNDKTLLAQANAQARQLDLPLLVLGDGSNVRLRQRVEALVLQLDFGGITLIEQDEFQVVLEVGGGENWHRFVSWCLQQGYYGLENLALIPGTVGAAPVQNIGAYGVEVAQCIQSLEVFDCGQNAFKHYQNQDCLFAYRDSIFKQSYAQSAANTLIISSVRFVLSKTPSLQTHYPALQAYLGDDSESAGPEAVFAAVIALRQSKLPDPKELANAGSFFKNPVVDQACYQALHHDYPLMPVYPQANQQYKLAAAWLIEQAQGKSLRYKSLAMHSQQALVLVNHGGAAQTMNFDDLVCFSEMVRQAVLDKFAVELEVEPVVMV